MEARAPELRLVSSGSPKHHQKVGGLNTRELRETRGQRCPAETRELLLILRKGESVEGVGSGCLDLER